MSSSGDPQSPVRSGSLSLGEVVAERYRIDSVLGEGGMGIVYRAHHLHLRKTHALKVLLPMWSSMPEVVSRFEREAVAAGSIRSPHVAGATDFGRLPNGSFFLVMEYVDGVTLRNVLEAGPLDAGRALHVVRGIVSALHAAHAIGIVHRDMKPENVMLVDRDGDADFVKVLDFGIAKVDSFDATNTAGPSKALTQVGAVIGTPDYMSPEQALGGNVDARSDLYSVGVILFEMLTGRCPFAGGAVTILRQHIMAEVPDLPSAVAEGIDPRMAAIVRRLMAKVPDQRFASTTDLTAALDELASEPAEPEPSTSLRPSGESVQAMTTPVAQRVRRSVLGGMRALKEAARLTLADPKAVFGRRRAPLMLATSAFLLFATIFVVLAVGARAHSSASAAPGATESAPAPASAGAGPVFSSSSSEPANVASPSASPPDPPVSASTADAGAQPSRPPPGRPRRTGPGGIYVPPPRTWFK
jgi:eukaryotic-like serine/threonine-protein kinase